RDQVLLQSVQISVTEGLSMILMTAALLVFAQPAADQQPPSPATTVPAPKTVKEKKICKTDDAASGTRMTKRICLTEGEWAQRTQGMSQSARAGMSGKAEDH
ncbi:MAG: hypothetical protein ACJ8FF_05415, partial [Sphingomicrobium sp.]